MAITYVQRRLTGHWPAASKDGASPAFLPSLGDIEFSSAMTRSVKASAMSLTRPRLPVFALLVYVCALFAPKIARGDLRWELAKKESIRLRLVALAWNHPRSSFFSSEEIFIAEKQLSADEGRLVKLVYDFMPYQPRLSESGFDYSTVHELRAVRNPDCDETVTQMTTGDLGDWRQSNSELKYSTDAPQINLTRRRNPLPCYVTTADDYTKPLHEPEPGTSSPTPVLTPRHR